MPLHCPCIALAPPGSRPWAQIDEQVTGLSSEVVGACHPCEVAVMNSLSVNLHLLLTAFYRPSARRHKIIIEDNAFCSDNHIFASQIRLHGFDPAVSLVRVAPRDGCDTIAHEDILAAIDLHGDETAVVCFAGVQFYSGQVLYSGWPKRQLVHLPFPLWSLCFCSHHPVI
jgi:kynureninase